MSHHHVWFTFQPEVGKAAGLATARDFVAALTARAGGARALILKNTAEPPKSRLPHSPALFEFRDAAQGDATFADTRAEGIHAGLHGRIIAAVAESNVNVFHEA